MRDKIYCDYCNMVINDDYEEVSFLLLEMACNIFLFCDEDCMNKYIKECTFVKYVDYEGKID